MIFLRYVASGSFMIVSGDIFNIKKSTAWSAIHKMIKKIGSLRSSYIKFPPPDRFSIVEAQFRHKKGFPGIIGCIDGTQIPLQVPSNDQSELFRCRKGFFSLNVQLVCGPNCKIYDIVSSYHGSAHDSLIWNESDIAERFQANEFSGYHLLGDSGYPLEKYLLTPFRNDETLEKSNLYNPDLI